MSSVRLSGAHRPLGPLHQRFVQEFSSQTTGKLRAMKLAQDISRQLAVHAINTQVPKAPYTVTTRMKVETPPIEVPDTKHKIIVVGVVRAGVAVSQSVYEYLLEAGFNCRHDLVTAERVTNAAGRVINVDCNLDKVKKLEKPPAGSTVIIVDPMGATGVTGTALAQYYQDLVGETGKVIFLHLIATWRAIRKVRRKVPNAVFIVGRIDPKLTDEGYIIWGAGDIGQLFFEFEAYNEDVEQATTGASTPAEEGEAPKAAVAAA